ncbi:multiprotein-bridging factor 1 family protein [Streptomyces sp. NPDC088726]|uniref:helix-turn-helix domain-containing protein n=1 Tax=Streptomyces sp. NPDC088726 TaxID=3365874 RepID=UPI00381FF1FD
MSNRKGRPPKKVANAANPIGELAELLRKGRQSKGLTREQLASKLGRSVSAVQRAERGGNPPPQHTIHGYIGICDLDPVKTEALWKKAVNYRQGITRLNFTSAPHIDLVRDPHEFGAALARAWEKGGRPSTRVMEERADRHYRETHSYAFLSRSSAGRFSRRKCLPGSDRTLQAYLVALQIPESSFPRWVQAWRRVHEQRLAQRKADRGQAKMTKQMEAPVAKIRMQEVGLVPREKFPGAVAPWSAVHTACGQVSRYRLRSILQGTAQCPVCDELLTAGTAPDEGRRA